MSKLQKTGLVAIAVVVAIGIAIVAYSTLRDRHTMEEKNVVTISEALSMYWKDNGRYPEDLDVLFEQYGLKQEQTQGYSYLPIQDYGSYSLSIRYETADGIILGTLAGPPPAEMSHEALAADLVSELTLYYSQHGRYPDTLPEGIDPIRTELLKATQTEDFVYSVSEDKQSCSLDGRTIEPIRLFSPAEAKERKRELIIDYLMSKLRTYREDNGRYPETLQELSGYTHRLDEFLIEYQASADGKEASLDGKKIDQYDNLSE